MKLLTIEDEIRAESLAKGRTDTQREIYERLRARGMSEQEPSDITGWRRTVATAGALV